MTTHRTPGPPRVPFSLDDLLRRVLRLLAPDRPRFLLVRSNDPAASAALIAAVLDRHHGRAQVVLHPSDPLLVPYRFAPTSTRSWAVLPASSVPGTLDQTVRSMRTIQSTLQDDEDGSVARCLWLPPSVLEGYARVPASPEGILVIDDWHALVEDYLDDATSASLWIPEEGDLDPLLVEVFRSFSQAHLVVVTKRPSQVLSDAADAVLDVQARAQGDGIVEVRLERDAVEPPSTSPYVLRMDRDGSLA